MSARFDLVVVGDVNPDLVVSAPDLRVEFGQRETLAEHAEQILGGSSSIAACAAAALGLRVAFVGLVGDDPAGRFCVEQLRSHGVDVDGIVVDPDVPTGLTVIMQRTGDRAIVTVPGSIAALAVRHLDMAIVTAARHLHVGAYYLLDSLRPDLPDVFRSARAAGLTTSLDPNDDPTRRWAIDAMLDQCDLLLPNDSEACEFTGLTDARAATRVLARRVGTVAVTAGAAGAFVARGESVVEAAPRAVDPSTIVDAVGAGDNFDAGFLYGFVHDWPLDRCLRAGLGAASLSLRGRGGTGALGTIDEALAAAEAT